MARILGVFLLVFVGNAFADEPPAYRRINCHVIGEDGLPATGIEVQLRGMRRDALGVGREEKNRGWNFRTDRHGNFTARFGRFRQYDHQQATGLVEPGYGHFYFVAHAASSTGGVSRQILNLNDEELAERTKHQDQNQVTLVEGEEWTRGEFAPCVLTDKPNRIEIVLKSGLSLTGRIVDTTGLPVRGEEVTLFLDLHADSHSGRGGEIFPQHATSDRAGHFYFRYVYPNTFYLALLNDSSGPPYWIRTRVRNRWRDKVEDEITPRQNESEPSHYEKSIDMQVVVARQAPYRYFGRVTNADGKAVANAEVEIRCSLHEPERTFADNHDYWWRTRTDATGNYSVRVGSRFVNAIWVTAGNERGTDDAEEDELMAPGRYDITVSPAKK